MIEQVKEAAGRLQPEIVEIRRQIHSNPELGFAEWETSELINRKLSGLGLEIKRGIAKTGITALLRVSDEAPTVALRADMDALPVEEMNDVPYRSKNPGVMHACGHDAHVAMLIGAAKILAAMRDKLKVNVKFIFQPCEEQPRGGAEPMIKEGVLESPKVDAIFALHVNPYLPAGFLGFKAGPVMAAADQFTIEVTGKGGHGAAPHQTVDPVVAAAQVILALQSVVSRQTDPVEPAVVSICAVHGGQSFNVIADRVTLTGTVRTLNPNIQKTIPERIRTITEGITSAFGAESKLDYQWGYPILVNNGDMLKIAMQAGRDIAGRQKVINMAVPSMGAEDFACYTGRIPGAYFFLGVSPPGGDVFPWHNCRFDIDESALATGTAVLTGCVLQAQETLVKGEQE